MKLSLVSLVILGLSITIQADEFACKDQQDNQVNQINSGARGFGNIEPRTLGQNTASHCSLDPLEIVKYFRKDTWPLKETFCDALVNTLQSQINLSSQCKISLSSYEKDLREIKHDALVMFDLFSTSLTDWLGGKRNSFGHFEQCIQSQFRSVPSRYVLIEVFRSSSANESQLLTERLSEDYVGNRTDSWTAHLRRHSDEFKMFPHLMAICVPSQCNEADLTEITRHISRSSQQFSLTIHSTQTLVEDPYSWYNGSLVQVVSRTFLILFIIWLIVTNLLCYRGAAMSEKLFVSSFSIKKNLSELFDLQDELNSPTCYISGAKGIYLLYSIHYHLYRLTTVDSMFHLFQPFHSRMQSSTYLNLEMRYLAQFSTIVAMSGILQALSWFNQRQVPSFGRYISRRALRTLPVTVVRILFVFSLPLALYSGPMAPALQNSMLKKCLRRSWMDLLFISNWSSGYYQCLSVHWFVSADFQLFILSFVSLVALSKYPRVGFTILALQMAVGIAFEVSLIIYSGLQPTVPTLAPPRLSQLEAGLDFGHFFTHNHIASYSYGILFGYLMHKKIKLPWFTISVAYTLSFIPIIAVALIYTPSLESLVPRPLEILVSPCLKLSFANILSMGLLLLSHAPNISIFKAIFSCKFLVFLNRVCFTAYMVHPFVIFYTQVNTSNTDHSSTFESMQYFFVVTVSILIAILIKVSVEMPFENIFRVMYHVRKSHSVKNS